jgi:hypothetical protein
MPCWRDMRDVSNKGECRCCKLVAVEAVVDRASALKLLRVTLPTHFV